MPPASAYSVRLLEEKDTSHGSWGGGPTAQLWIDPPGSKLPRDAKKPGERFAFRVSRAGIDKNGPFSDFSGYDRTIFTTWGDGVELTHVHRGQVRLAPFQPHRFRGDWNTEARIQGGAVPDFNVFSDRALGRHSVRVHRLGADPEAFHTAMGDYHFFHLLEGGAEILVGGSAMRLTPGQSLLFSADSSGPVRHGEELIVQLLGSDAVVAGVDFFLNRTGERFGFVPPSLDTFSFNYSPPPMSAWGGRVDSTTDASAFRIHQVVKPLRIFRETDGTLRLEGIQPMDGPFHAYALVGFRSDLGVKRNHGNVGAVDGPEAIRKQLGILPVHMKASIYDAGDIVIADDTAGPDPLHTAQMALSQVVQLLLSHGLFPIVLGGGHEVAFGHGHGILEWHQNNRPWDQVAIINHDAHFDLRPMEEGLGTSGTPFLQLAEYCGNRNLPFRYLCLGVQLAANTSLLFETAHRLGVGYLFAEEMRGADPDDLRSLLDFYLNRLDALYLTNCLDVFGVAHAPGVSAINPDGLSPAEIYPAFDHLVRSGRLASLDVAELAPQRDRDHQTAKLAARLIHRAMLLRSGEPQLLLAEDVDAKESPRRGRIAYEKKQAGPWGIASGRPIPRSTAGASLLRATPFGR